MSLTGPRKCRALLPRRAGQPEPPRCGTPIRQSGGPGRLREVCCEACEIRWRRERERDAAEATQSVQWFTPEPVFRWFVDRWGPFTIDPCANPRSPVWPLVPHHLFLGDGGDGIRDRWGNGAGCRAFVNPPYGPGREPLRDWSDRAYRAVRDGEVELAAMLVPLRPSSGWRKIAKARGAVFESYDESRVKFLELDLETGTLGVASGALFECEAVVFSVAPVTGNGAAA